MMEDLNIVIGGAAGEGIETIVVVCRNSGWPLFGERFRRKISDQPLAALPWPDRKRIADYIEEFRRRQRAMLRITRMANSEQTAAGQ